jgi:RNA-directed DNA polymerase
MVKFLQHRSGDDPVIRLIIRMLNRRIMEDGLIRATEQGTPQGAIVSFLLSYIYLHYVSDLRFSQWVSRQSRGEAYYFRS